METDNIISLANYVVYETTNSKEKIISCCTDKQAAIDIYNKLIQDTLIKNDVHRIIRVFCLTKETDIFYYDSLLEM